MKGSFSKEEDDSNSALAYIYMSQKQSLANFPITFNHIFPTNNFTLFLMSFTMASSTEQTTAKSQDTSCSNSVFNETLATQSATNLCNETEPLNEDNTITTLRAAISRVQEHMDQEGSEGSLWQKITKVIQSVWQGTPSKFKKAAMQRFHKSIKEMSTATDALASFTGWLSHQSPAPKMQDLISVDVSNGRHTASEFMTPGEKMMKCVRDVRKKWVAVETAAGEDYVKTSIAKWPNDVQEQYKRAGELVTRLCGETARSLSEARFARTWSL